MLLQVKDYEKLFQNETDLSKDPGVLLYILDETSEISELIQRVSTSLELTSYSVNCDIDSTLSYQRESPSIASWLKGFSQAEFVITDFIMALSFLYCLISHGLSEIRKEVWIDLNLC